MDNNQFALGLSQSTRLYRLADKWCSTDNTPIWDGVDLSVCFRTRVLNGFLPLAFLFLSLLSFTILFLYQLFIHFRSSAATSIPLSTSSVRRLSRSSSRSRALATTEQISTKGPEAISQAENEVIITVVQEESPDLTLNDILDLRSSAAGSRAGRNRTSGTTGTAVESALDDDDDENKEEGEEVKFTWRMALKALGGTKKDMSNVIGAGGLLALLILKLVKDQGEDGSNWMAFLVTSWAWTLLLALTKFAISFQTRLYRLEHPSLRHTISDYYTLLEMHIIPWLLAYAFIAFFDFRSSLLYFLSHSSSSSTQVKIDTSIFMLSLVLFSIELFSPRPSRFSSRKDQSTPATEGTLPKSLEPHASLFALATFTYIDKFLVTHAFPSSTTSPISKTTIPDLRADDKTARVLLAYRQDCAVLNSGKTPKNTWGLTARLLWHFRSELMLQQFWGYLHVAVVALPPMLLQQVLRHIEKRGKGEVAPMHVALLFVALMFVAQVVESVTASQGLFIGRRLCIRIRSIVIAEVFTKALRRKDMAGLSGPPAEENVEGGKKVDDKEGKKLTEDEEMEKASSGKIVNLISVDTFRVSEIAAYLHFIWPDLSLTIVITIVLLFRVLGWSAIAGLATLVILTPLQALSSKWFYVFQKRLLAAADTRLNLATEVITSVRIVKYFAWEKKFLDKMQETREKELSALWMRALTVVAGGMLMFGAPVFVSVATFVFHTKVLHLELNAETAFTALALFNILRGPLEGFTDMLVNVLQAHVSLKRIEEFLTEEETQKYSIIRSATSASDPVVGFSQASFTWSDEKAAREDPSIFRLQDLNLSFPAGKFSIILGPVGSGKTTLLMSLLGETNKLAGQSFLPSPVVRSTGSDPSILTDTTAYCSQSPWLLSDTIQANILFGSPMNASRYKTVLDVCALEPDLKQFELGDATEVGEKGTVLSGGQKARISLARAIYSPAKHILADDVLSAVDSHTAQHLFQKCLRGKLMRHRTCIMVTHAVDLCAPGAAFVVSMDGGAVVTSGPPASIVGLANLNFVSLKPNSADAGASTFTIEEIASGESDELTKAHEADKKRALQEKLKLVKDETQSTGMISADVYLLYLRSMGGWWLAGATLGIFVLAQAVEIAVSVALRHWTESYDAIDVNVFRTSSASTMAHHISSRFTHPIAFLLGSRNSVSILGTGNEATEYWLRAYVLLAVVNLFLYSGRSAFFLHRGLAASRVLYTNLIGRILGAPIRFFDSTPTGRILNRLSKDVETIDQDIAMTLTFFLLEVLGVMAIIITIAAVLPAFLIAAFFITLAYWLIGYIYLASSRELKRTESVTRSPIFSLFGEALQGVSTIRAYSDSARFTKQVFNLINDCNRPFFAIWQANRWLSIRVDVAGAFVTLSAALFVLYAKSMDAALAGFVLSLAMSFMARILWVVRLWSMVDLNFNSVERVKEYLEIDQEKTDGITPPARWPSRDGSINVEGLTASYAPELPPVLKNVTFKVNPREKVGICGRTGSGKSTLGLSFFRFIEPTSGRIVIDGIDINTLNLAELRTRLTIVAQESALFAGSLRFNLDPFSAYEDADIWDALRRVQMAPPLATPRASRAPSRAPSVREGTGIAGSDSEDTVVEGDERYAVKSLEMAVTESGKNFSAGERQLLALARGILKLQSSSILILDESTASLDQATDEKIQKTIRDEMADATILCIAHRLRTIVDYDKILVLDHGDVLEYAAPWELLDQEDSAFNALCKNSGEYEALCAIAYAKRDRKGQGSSK